jgi:hypothetical protein
MLINKVWKLVAAGVLVGAIAVGGVACSSATTTITTTAAAQAAQNLILSSDMVTGSGGTVKAASACVLSSQYKAGSQVVFRVRVYDPVTGQPMDDTALKSVTISLPDGQTFSAKYSGHPSSNPLDHFWATSWVIPDNYPSGTLGYTATATAADGRTGTFDAFNVQPSLLTVIQ